MKRLIVIVCCLFVVFAGAASVWANCKQISFETDHNRYVSVSQSAHEKHSGSHHDHSDGAEVHCPPFKEFVPSAVISVKSDRKLERVANPFVAALVFYIRGGGFFRLIHGPPAITQSNDVPFYIALSVLRI